MGKAFLFLVVAMATNGSSILFTWLAISAMIYSLIEMNGGLDGLFEQSSRRGTGR